MSLNIAHQRLQNEYLVGDRPHQPAEVVGWLGAVQAQDYPGAKWAVGQRLANATNLSIEKAFNEGSILRTHVLRPTWHFVTPADIRWMLQLTAPRVRAVSAYYFRKVGLDGAIFNRAHEALAKALQGGKYFTRDQISDALTAAGLQTTGMPLRFPYILIEAELAGLICSGPRIGNQHTYALLEERVPQAKELTREEALAELTKRYFTSHGPALVHDFAWWSGLTVADAKQGIHMVKDSLVSEVVKDKMYWFVPRPDPLFKRPLVHLLPNYDEYLIAYKDRSASFDQQAMQSLNLSARPAIFMNHLVVIDGFVVGGWRRVLSNKSVIEVTLLAPLTKPQQAAFDTAVQAYSTFLGTRLISTFAPTP